jgi:flavorubredoxin
MAFKKITENVYSVGVMHWDRKFFDELIPLPDGTSYNSFIVTGSEKTALIDTVDPSVREEMFMNLKKLGIKNIDYVICNHAEQDHSGSIPYVLHAHPEAKLVTNEKCGNMLKDHLGISAEKMMIIKEGDTLDLGGKTLEFIMTPWVHWPETQSTFLREEGVLFSCDFFGAHMAIPDILKGKHFYIPAKRYYAEIMAPFRNNVRTNLAKVEALNVKIIAPSHGCVHLDPSVIMKAYKDWSSENVKNEVVIAFVSMHDSTRRMAEYLREALIERGINVHFFNLTTTDIGVVAMCLVDAATLIVGAPTVLAGIHPVAANAVFIANAVRPKTKFLSMITSYGWGEKATEAVKAMTGNIKAEMIAPVVVKGLPGEAQYRELDRLADGIAAKHREIGILK